MGRFYDYVIEVREKSRDAFALAYPNSFVLQHIPSKNTDGQWTFNTLTLSASMAMSVAQMVAREKLRLSPEFARYNVFEVVKAAKNPWPDRVSVGRARNNDIVLADNSVSKLHAHFTRGSRGENLLVDAGSRNGTKVNERALGDHQQVELQIGDLLTFGGVNVTYVDAGTLYDMINKGIEEAH